MKTCISYFLLFFLLLAFLTSFWTGGTIMMNHISKSVYFSVVVFLLACCVCITHMFFQAAFKPIKFGRLDLFVLGYYLLCMVGPITNGSLLTNEKALALSDLFLFYILCSYFFSIYDLNDKRNRRIISLVFTTFILGELIVGLSQLYNIVPSLNTLYRITGDFINPAPFAIYISTGLPLLLGFYFSTPTHHVFDKAGKNFILIVFLLGITVLPVSQNRTSWIAGTIGTFIVLNARFNFINRLSLTTRFAQKISLFCLLGLLIFASLYLYRLKADSADGRFFRWKVALSIIKDRPVLGNGYGTFHKAYNLAQADWFRHHQESKRNILLAGDQAYAYNEFLETAVETGLISLLVFIGILIVSIKKLASGTSPDQSYLSAGCRGTIIAFTMASLFSYPFSILPVEILLFYCLALASRNNAGSKELVDRAYINKNRMWQVTFFVALVAASLLIMIALYHQYSGMKNWDVAKKLEDTGAIDNAGHLYNEACKELSANGEFLKEYGIFLLNTNRSSEAIKLLERGTLYSADPDLYIALGDGYHKHREFKLAEEKYKSAGYIDPKRFVPQYKLLKLYLLEGDSVKARSMATYINQMDIKVNSPEIRAIKKEIEYLDK